MIDRRAMLRSLKRRGLIGLSVAAALSVTWLLLTEWLLFSARSQLLARRPEECLSRIRWFEAIRTPTGESRFLAGRSFRRIGDMAAAQTCLNEAAQRGWPRESVEREGWLIQAQAGAISRVESKLQKLLVSPGEDAPEICEAYVCGFLVNYRFDDAMGLLDAWQADFPNDAQPLLIRGQCYEHVRNLDQAITFYEAAIALDGSRRDLRRAWAKCLVELHRHDEARREVERLLNEDSEDIETQILAGRLFLETADAVAAEAHLRAALQIAPQNKDALRGLVKVLLASDRPEEALSICRALVRDNPGNTETGFLLQRALTLAGLIAEARETGIRYEKLRSEQTAVGLLVEQIRDNPRDSARRLEIGRILASYGEPGDARVWLRSVLEIDPDNREALQLLQQLGESRPSPSAD